MTVIGEASETRHGRWQWALVVLPGGLAALAAYRAWRAHKGR